MQEKKYSQEDYKLVNSIKWSIYRALWSEIIPSLRAIILKWEPGDAKAWVYFYHDGKITDAIENHYSCIMTEVDADYWGSPVITDFEVIRSDYPDKIPLQENFVVYLRKEPFVDPKD